jgi:O-antigen/teichoic acid export membrane protein
MREGLPLLGHKLLTLFSGQFDLIVLLWITGPENVGIYALASRAVDPLASIALAYVNGLYPLLCTKFQSGKAIFTEMYCESMRIIALIVIPLAIFVSTSASTIVSLLGGKTFMAATIAVQLLMWAMVASFFNQVTEQACVAARLEKRIPLVTSISACINLLSNLLLVPRWQIAGAGIAAVAGECVGMMVFMFLLKSHVHLRSTLLMLLRVCASNTPTLLFLLWQQHLALLLKLPIAVVLTIIIYSVTQTCSLRDIEMVKRIMNDSRTQQTTVNAKEANAVTLEVQRKLSIYPTLTLPRIHV